MYEKMYLQIQISELVKIEKLTGCVKPCYYKKYNFIGDKQYSEFKQNNFYTLSFWAVSNETTVRKEVLLYPFTSLVAEFGGILSLFLGISFMTGWNELLNLISLAQRFKDIFKNF